MTVGEALRGWEVRWDELQKLTACHFDKKGTGRRVWTSKKKRNYLRDVPHESMDDRPACLYAAYKALDRKSRLDPYLFFIGWIIYKYKKRADKIFSRLSRIDEGFRDLCEDKIAFKRSQGYLIKVIEAAIVVFKLKLTMLSEGWDIKVYQKAVAMGYQSAIKKEEEKFERFPRWVDKKKGPDGTVSLRSIQRHLNPPAIKKSGSYKIGALTIAFIMLLRFLEGTVERGFLDTETGICRGKRKDQLLFRFNFHRRGEDPHETLPY